MLVRGALIVLAFVAVAGSVMQGEQAAVMAKVQGQSRQLQLIRNDTVDVVRAHVFAMQRAVQHGLVRQDADTVGASAGVKSGLSQGAWTARGNKGSVHAHPNAVAGSQPFQETLNAAANLVPVAAAAHQWRDL